jgi:hypothetical protein
MAKRTEKAVPDYTELIKSTPKPKRRKLATAEFVLSVATSAAVTDNGLADEIAAKYGLSYADMREVAELVGARLEAWAQRLDYEHHWDTDMLKEN